MVVPSQFLCLSIPLYRTYTFIWHVFQETRICISENMYSFTDSFMRQEMTVFVIFASIFHAHLPSASPAMQCFWQIDRNWECIVPFILQWVGVSALYNAPVPSLTNSLDGPGFEVLSCGLPVQITSSSVLLVVVDGAVWFVLPCSSCDSWF